MAHIDTYVSPTSWTDFDMDWENPNSQKACYVDALLQAVKERGSVRGGTGYSFSHVTPDALLSYQTLRVIHLAILGMIPYFLDPENPTAITTGSFKETIDEVNYYTDYSYGSYQGGTINDSLPLNYLTLSSISEKLGLSEILSPQPYGRDNSAWLKQCYDIINLLKISTTTFNAPAMKYQKFRSRIRFKQINTPEDEYNENVDETREWSGWSSFAFSDLNIYSTHEDSVSYPIIYIQVFVTSEGESKFGIYFPTSWKLLGYFLITDYFPRKDFKSNYFSHPGYHYIELENNFQSGFQEFFISLGTVSEFLPLPSSKPGSQGGSLSHPQDFIIEHNFKFKQEL